MGKYPERIRAMDNNVDVIIAGTGVSGLYSALNLPINLKILLITKREAKLCNSSLAQGGIAGVYNSDDDNTQLHKNDTFIAGGFKNSNDAVDVLVTNAKDEIGKIIELGVDFDKNTDGTYNKTLEGGHCRRRIFHHKDATGEEIVDKLLLKVKSLPNVTIMENTLLCDMKKTETGFSAYLLKDDEYITVNSHFAIFGTGGIGRVYEYTTNSAIATGDGIALAYEMGARIKNLHLVQFHPTAFNNMHTRECFLISEAVRGEGAYLRNCNKERFMQNYDERLELAPRDVVSNSIIKESKKTNSKDFYLDITHKDGEFIKKRFPMIYKNLLAQGYDLTKDLIPIYPCQHYLMGGIDVDINAETTIPDMYAVGECSHTGVHGNNRLASNSLLEALVFPHRAALDIAQKSKTHTKEYKEYEFKRIDSEVTIPHGIRTEVRKIMQSAYFVVPEKEELKKSFERVKELKAELENGKYKVNSDYIEAKAVTTIAYIILNEVK